MKAAVLAFSMLAFIDSAPASAAQYLVSFGSSLGAFNGTVTTSPDLNQITGFTGTFGGNPVALLPSGSFAGNDNLFSSTSPYVDSHGIAFSSGGLDYTLFNSFAFAICSNQESCANVTNFSVQSVSGGVPEPATWVMMLLGFGGIGFALRRRNSAAPLLT